jgi:hypothetical protein
MWKISLVQQSGAGQLRAWIQKRFKTNREAAEYLGIPGVDDVVLNKILNAGRRPELEKLVIIEEKTGIPIRAWVSSDVDIPEPVGARTGKKRR